MWALILSNWKLALGGAAVGMAIGAGSSALLTHKLDAAYYGHEQQVALDDQQKDLNAKCEKAKQITSEVSNDYQAKNTLLVKRLAALSVRPRQCVPIMASSAGGHDGSTPDARLSQPHGVYSDALIQFAGDAEQVGLQLDACQSFVRKAEALNHN